MLLLEHEGEVGDLLAHSLVSIRTPSRTWFPPELNVTPSSVIEDSRSSEINDAPSCLCRFRRSRSDNLLAPDPHAKTSRPGARFWHPVVVRFVRNSTRPSALQFRPCPRTSSSLPPRCQSQEYSRTTRQGRHRQPPPTLTCPRLEVRFELMQLERIRIVRSSLEDSPCKRRQSPTATQCSISAHPQCTIPV